MILENHGWKPVTSRNVTPSLGSDDFVGYRYYGVWTLWLRGKVLILRTSLRAVNRPFALGVFIQSPAYLR
ncbi:hypothetical protein D3C84_413090 [compost metagenome]